MPLLIDGGRIPPRWAEKKSVHSRMSNAPYESAPGCVRIALVNNMPDPALEDTEMQFMELLDAASGDVPVRISLYSLPAVPRGERAQEHLNSFYFSIDSLWNKSFDAVIVTGTEPRHSDLRQEPYWRSLTTVFDWAERNTVSTVLSCLAAHASVLHSDGIQRQPLKDKKFGVFQAESILDHELTRRATRPLSFPHSRWNEAPEHALIACGYSILTRSAQAGPDLFVKQKRKSLFVHFQGHPEYGAQTLLKEYRRDIKRFLRYERETYPAMPHGYFGSVTAAPLAEFQKGAFANRGEEQMALFPETALAASLRNTWWPGAISIYRNWLRYVSSRKSANGAFAAMAQDIRGSAVAPGNERV